MTLINKYISEFDEFIQKYKESLGRQLTQGDYNMLAGATAEFSSNALLIMKSEIGWDNDPGAKYPEVEQYTEYCRKALKNIHTGV